MQNKALGLIEVKGYLGAVAAADTALKTADVTLLNAEVIKGGQTTLQFIGDVSAVTVAIEAGKVEAERLGCLLSTHVIPRMAASTAELVDIKRIEPVVEEVVIVEEIDIVVEEDTKPESKKKANDKKKSKKK